MRACPRHTTLVGASYPEVITGLGAMSPPEGGENDAPSPALAGEGRGEGGGKNIDSRYITVRYLHAIWSSARPHTSSSASSTWLRTLVTTSISWRTSQPATSGRRATGRSTPS